MFQERHFSRLGMGTKTLWSTRAQLDGKWSRRGNSTCNCEPTINFLILVSGSSAPIIFHLDDFSGTAKGALNRAAQSSEHLLDLQGTRFRQRWIQLVQQWSTEHVTNPRTAAGRSDEDTLSSNRPFQWRSSQFPGPALPKPSGA